MPKMTVFVKTVGAILFPRTISQVVYDRLEQIDLSLGVKTTTELGVEGGNPVDITTNEEVIDSVITLYKSSGDPPVESIVAQRRLAEIIGFVITPT